MGETERVNLEWCVVMRKQKQPLKVKVDFDKLKEGTIQLNVPDTWKFMRIIDHAYINFNAKVDGVRGRFKIRCFNSSCKNGIKPVEIDIQLAEKNITDLLDGKKGEVFIESSVGSTVLKVIGVG